MIKATELRIGNALIYGAHGVAIVYEIKKAGKVRVAFTEQDSIDKGYINILFWEDQLTPIPLTPEILEKCGFELQEFWTFVFSADGVNIDIRHGFQPVVMSPDDWVEFGKPIEYLHQLQNLYFALTGEELTIHL